jgi:hypothetical protein
VEQSREVAKNVVDGPKAPLAFRALVAEAELNLKLEVATGWGLELGPETPQRWLEASLVGSSIALGTVIGEAFERGEQVGVLYQLVAWVFNPGFELRFAPNRAVRVQRPESAALRRARLQESVCSWCRPKSSSLAMGIDPLFRELNDPHELPWLSLGGWAQAGWGSGSVTAPVRLQSYQWMLRARQERAIQVGSLFIDASAWSPEFDPDHPNKNPVLDQVGVGIGWRTPGDLQLRLGERRDLKPQSDTVMLSVQLLR